MEVIEHQESAWFLFHENGQYFLDVNSGDSAFGFSISVELTESEVEKYKAQGLGYVRSLANEISSTGNPRHPRHVIDFSARRGVMEAIQRWRENAEGGRSGGDRVR